MKVLVTLQAYQCAHTDAVYALHPAGDNGYYSGSGDGRLLLWQLSAPNQATLLAQVNESIYTINAIHQHLLVIGTNAGAVYVIDTRDKRLVTSIEVGHGIYASLVVGHTLWLACAQGYLCQVDLRDWSTKGPWKIAQHHIRCLSPDTLGGRVLAGSSDHSIVCVTREGSVAWVKDKAHGDSVFALALSPGGMLLSGGKDAHIRQWKIGESGLELLNDVPAHLFAVNQLALHPSEKWVASASRDKTIRIWETNTLLLKKVISREKVAQASTHSVNRLFWLDATHLVAAGDDRVIRVYHLDWEA